MTQGQEAHSCGCMLTAESKIMVRKSDALVCSSTRHNNTLKPSDRNYYRNMGEQITQKQPRNPHGSPDHVHVIKQQHNTTQRQTEGYGAIKVEAVVLNPCSRKSGADSSCIGDAS